METENYKGFPRRRKTDFPLGVYQNRETYTVSKFYTLCSLLKAVEHNHIFHDLNCKSKLLIYVMECRVCRIQYIEKSEMEFNIRLSNHQW